MMMFDGVKPVMFEFGTWLINSCVEGTGKDYPFAGELDADY